MKNMHRLFLDVCRQMSFQFIVVSRSTLLALCCNYLEGSSYIASFKWYVTSIECNLVWKELNVPNIICMLASRLTT